MNRLITCIVASVGIAAAAHADVARFDFEAAAAGPTTSLTVSDAGLSMSVRRGDSLEFQVLNTTGYPATWGHQAIAPFGVATGDAFVMNFSMPVTRVTFETGDFGPGDSDLMATRAFSGQDASGSEVDEGTYYYTEQMGLPNDVWVFELVAGAGESIRSVWFDSMDLHNNMSVIFDNVVVTFVPAPGTVGLALLAAAALRRKR